MADLRKLPVAAIDVFDPLEGDNVVTDHGNGWYDLLERSWTQGKFLTRKGALPTLEFFSGIGLVCRPFIVPQHTQKVHWNTWTSTDNPWSERSPTSGYYAVNRLFQGDGSPGVTYSAESTWDAPKNPHFAFSLMVEETPSDWPAGTANEPYIQLDMGDQQWGIRLDKQGARLIYYSGGVPIVVSDLPSPSTGGYNDLDEQWFLVRCLRGSIQISTDFGKTYTGFAFPDANPTEIRSGKMKVHGRGGKIAFGIHQILYYSGSFRSLTWNTLTTRLVGATPTYVPWEYANAGTVSITDQSSTTGAFLRYAVSLTATSQYGVPFTFYETPTYQAATVTYPITHTTATQAFTNPFQGKLKVVEIQKPVRLECSTATFELDWGIDEDPFEGNYRWRKVRIKLGHKLQDNSVEYPFTYFAYIRRVTTTDKQNEWGVKRIKFECENPAIRFRRTIWWPTDLIPLGGLTINEALDYILYTEGMPLNSSYRVWHPLGDILTMDTGTAENPFEMLQAGEDKWTTMCRLASYMGLELVITDDGVIRTIPFDYVSPTVDHVYNYTGTNSDDKRNLIRELSNDIDYSESFTAAMVYGLDRLENGVMVWAVDWEAETNAASGRACPWREGVFEEINGTCGSVWPLIQRTQSLAYENFVMKYRPDIVAPVDIRLSRRMRVEVNGALSHGIPEGQNYVLLNMSHRYDAEEGFGTLMTHAGLHAL